MPLGYGGALFSLLPWWLDKLHASPSAVITDA